MIWYIFSFNELLQDLYIEADSFDEALEKARQIDSDYVGGCVVEKRGDVK